MCHPILVTLLKMQPHYSQTCRENGTPSSGTSIRSTPHPPAAAEQGRVFDVFEGFLIRVHNFAIWHLEQGVFLD